MLWGLLNSLQLIVHLPLLAIVLPYNTKVVYDTIYKLATFQLVPDSLIFDSTLGRLGLTVAQSDTKEEALNTELSASTLDAGFNEPNILKSSFALVLATATILGTLTLALILSICSPFSQKIRSFKNKLLRGIFWDAILRSVLEVCLETSINCMLAKYVVGF